jgi:dihydrofolate reductase
MINLIAAVAKNGIIGKNGTLPWRIPEDLKKFKQLTMSGVLFVGKNTSKGLPPLKDREIVLLRRNDHPTLEDMDDICRDRGKVGWLIGGGQVYEAALKLCADNKLDMKLYITTIDKEYDGDVFFPLHMIDDEWLMESEEVLKQEPLVKLQVWSKRK